MSRFDRFAKVLSVTVGLLAACTDAPSDDASSEDSISVTTDERSVVVVEGGARSCPAAALPGAYVLAPRACLEPSTCGDIDASKLHISAFSNIGPAGAFEVYVSEVLPAANKEHCSEFVVLRLRAPLQDGITTKVRDPASPMKVDEPVRLVSIDEGPADAGIDASDASPDVAVADAAVGDADTDAGDAEADAAPIADAGVDAGLAVVKRTKTKVTIGRVKAVSGDSVRRFDTSPSPSSFAIALDGASHVVGFGDASMVEVATASGFADVVSLYAKPSDLLDVRDVVTPTTPAEPDDPFHPSTGGGTKAGQRLPTAKDTSSQTSCNVSTGPSSSNAFGLALVVAVVLASARRRERMESPRARS